MRDNIYFAHLVHQASKFLSARRSAVADKSVLCKKSSPHAVRRSHRRAHLLTSCSPLRVRFLPHLLDRTWHDPTKEPEEGAFPYYALLNVQDKQNTPELKEQGVKHRYPARRNEFAERRYVRILFCGAKVASEVAFIGTLPHFMTSEMKDSLNTKFAFSNMNVQAVA